MRCKIRLLSALLCLSAIECLPHELYEQLDVSSDMPFDRLVDFYINRDWIDLQIEESSFSRFGLLQDGNRNLEINHLNNFFLFNKSSTTFGGAIECEYITLKNNASTTIFYGNMSRIRGSAIHASKTCTITQNTFPCLFINNVAFNPHGNQLGSCIVANSIIIENNPGLLLFKSNSTRDQSLGGALGATSLLIRNSGPIVFENNQARWGGAIATSPSGLAHIFADRGDIIFNNNLNRHLKRNAIHCQPNCNLHLGASKNYSMCFYDPVEATHPTPHPCILNPESHHLGTILFSGITLPKSLPDFSESLTSYFQNETKLLHGVLAIEERAFLFIHNLTQDEGVLRLGNKAVIATINEHRSTNILPTHLQISRLALNLPSLLQPNARPPQLWIYPKKINDTTFEETKDATITLSGDLLLYDTDNQDPYDSTDLSEPKTNIPLLYLCDTSKPKIDSSQLNVDAINQTNHYGYQGIWETFWDTHVSKSDPSSAETTNTQHRILYAHWKPSGYIPNPRNVSYLTANSLWMTAYNMMPYLQYLQTSPFRHTVIQAQGKATRMIHRQQSKDGIPGFNVNAKGYWTSITSSASSTNHQFSLQFGQNFTQSKEKSSHNRIASKEYTSAIQFCSSWYTDLIETSAKAAYAYGTHRIHNIYTDENPAYSVGDFYTTTLGASASTSLPISIPQLGSLLDPFVELKGVYASMSAFKEKGPYNKILRSFLTDTPLINLSSSLGATFYPLTPPKYIHWCISLAYQPTVYRQIPKLETVLLSSNGSWIVQGSSPEKHAALAQFNFVFSPASYFHAEAQYQGHFASSTTSHFITMGCSLHF